MPIYDIAGVAPVIEPSACAAAEATVIGNIALSRDCSVWSDVVVRGDNEAIYLAQEIG